LKPPSP
jgi:hypothetical protein